MNIETWGYIRHLFFVEKYAKKAIAKKLNLDPKTVRSALKKETFSRCNPGPRSSRLEEFREKISDLLQSYPGMSAVRIYEEIRKGGYQGGISILRSYLRPFSISRPSRQKKPR
jgi:transposase